ncbi:MAG TPA: SpoVG family protein [Clostridiaceae bacterium]|nr:SpoVG family protein [Clostridiaceae bacterium]
MEIKITDVKIFKIKQRGALLGYANIVLNNSFIIRGIKILESEKNGRFVAMPSRRLREEKRAYRDLCHPINQETREIITATIFNAYDELENIEE